MANANPLPDGGYHSVRTAPTAQQIADAEALYARMRADENITLHEGRVIGTGIAGKIKMKTSRIKLSHRFWAWAGASTALLGTAVALGIAGHQHAEDNLEIVTQRNVLPMFHLSELAQRMEVGQVEMLLALQHAPQNPLSAEHDHEVRKLAERTSTATAEIASTITTIQADASEAATSMLQGVERVQSGVALASKAGEELDLMREGSRKVTESVNAITTALEEQAMAAREIAERVEHVSQGTEAMVAVTRQTDQAAIGLKSLAQNLSNLASKFKTA